MHDVATTPRPLQVPVPPDVPDEDVARGSAARLLITASAHGGAEALARRIHEASARAPFAVVRTRAGDLPSEPWMLRDTCSALLDAAAGGTLVISDVDAMPPMVQELLIELLEDLEFARAPEASVRLVSDTAVPLLERIAAGTFSERLFYRLNIIHLRLD